MGPQRENIAQRRAHGGERGVSPAHEPAGGGRGSEVGADDHLEEAPEAWHGNTLGCKEALHVLQDKRGGVRITQHPRMQTSAPRAATDLLRM